MDDFRDKKITVMGLGLYGSGAAVARFLCRQGARVTVTDLKGADALAGPVRSLEGYDVTFHLGGHDPADFDGVDAVVPSPAVPQDSPYLARARESGADILYETNLFLERCPAPVIGVTGSNGKTTTATIISLMLGGGRRRVFLGGNVGQPLIEEAETMGGGDVVVMELSSFQLEAMRDIRKSPQVAVVTNLSPNHLDRHKTMESYIKAKHAIIDYQPGRSAAILNADDPIVSGWARECAGAVAFFSLEGEYEPGAFLRDGTLMLAAERAEHPIARADELLIPGRFNVANVLAASLAAHLLGAPIESIALVARTFRGIEHRLEAFAEWRGVRFVNDSKATTPTAAMLALEALRGKIVLIGGGYDKGLAIDGLAGAIAARCRAAVFIGEVGERMAELTCAAGIKTGIRSVTYAATLADAVAIAFTLLEPGDTLLLSPGFASWDMFPNYEFRGRQFKELVATLISKEPRRRS